eukprot:scaffold37784_cov83-Phaeocystis_antarctica.AAC.1
MQALTYCGAEIMSTRTSTKSVQWVSSRVSSRVSVGRWRKCHRRCSRKAHIVSFILVHVGVGQRCRPPDVESPAILPTMSTRNVTQRGRWTIGYYVMWVQLSRGLTSVATLS